MPVIETDAPEIFNCIMSEKMEELKSLFGLKTEELNIDLGPIGKLI